MAVLRCPRCNARLAATVDGRVCCLLCARDYHVRLEEDTVGPYTPDEEYRNLTEFIQDALTKGRRRDP